jgi:hypothetical protein
MMIRRHDPSITPERSASAFMTKFPALARRMGLN